MAGHGRRGARRAPGLSTPLDHLLLRRTDLPGDGWAAQVVDDGADPDGDGPPADDPFEVALAGFPEELVVASDSSPRFTRGDALAWSVAWALVDEPAATAAFGLLADDAFATSFVGSAAATVDPDDGAAILLAAGPGGPVDHHPGLDPARGVRHHALLTAGTGEGVFGIHLDLVALRGGAAVTFLLLADSPEPVPEPAVAAIAGRLAARLP